MKGTKEAMGFLIEAMSFILTGYYLAKGEVAIALFMLVISVGLAFFVGGMIEKRVRREKS